MRIYSLLLFSALVVIQVCAAQSKKYVVCYQGTWATYRHSNGKFDTAHIDPTLCTHLMYAFFGVQQDGNIRIIDPYLDLQENWGRGNIRKFTDLKRINPQLKVLAAIGGWNEGSANFSDIANDSIRRSRFISSSVAFLKKHGFDGLDLDWEYPNQRHEYTDRDDKANFVTLLRELKQRLSSENLLLTAAVGSAEFSSSVSYNIPEVSKYLDIINIMAYDLHGSWDELTGINAPLYAGPHDKTDIQKQLNVNASLLYWLNNGGIREKIVLGLPFYGRTFTLADPSKNTPGSPHLGRGLPGQYSNEPGHIGYNEICEKMLTENWNYVWEDTQKVPYIYRGDQWIGFENTRSIQYKTQFAMDNGLAGIMIWSLESDDFHGICGEKYPLLKTINSLLSGKTTFSISPSALSVGSAASVAAVQSVAAAQPVTSAPQVAPVQPVTPAPQVAAVRPPQPTPAPPAHHPIEELCQRSAGFLRDPDDCSKFYYCATEIMYHFKCPPNLVFDTDVNACNYQEYVVCN